MADNKQTLLRQRLLRDLTELQQNPYPGIELRLQDQDALQRACFMLRPQGEGERPLHLTIRFKSDYPLSTPEVTMQSTDVVHPNIFDDYICASILNTTEGLHTSVYPERHLHPAPFFLQ